MSRSVIVCVGPGMVPIQIGAMQSGAAHAPFGWALGSLPKLT